MPLKDNPVMPEPERTLSTTVYRKHTHTDPTNKYIKTSKYYKDLSIQPGTQYNEDKKQYPDDASKNNTTNKPEQPKNNIPHRVVQYPKGLSESFENICNKHEIQVHFKRGRTMKNLLVAPRDKVTITKESGVIYRYMCVRVKCDYVYVGESTRTLRERFKEYLKAPPNLWISKHDRSLHSCWQLQHYEKEGPEPQ